MCVRLNRLHQQTFRATLALMASMAIAACAGAPAAGSAARPAGPGAPGGQAPLPSEMQRIYRSMGLISGAGGVPFVSSVTFLRASQPDSTLMLVALSLPSRVLAFQREGDRYVASYAARVQLRRGSTVVRTVEATEMVRVPTFRETARTDESVIWQQFMRLAPGRYTMTLSIRDEGSTRTATEEVALEVPRLIPGTLGSPVPVYEAIPRLALDSLPRILARPRSSVVFGQDSVLPLYLDAVGEDAPSQVRVRVFAEGDVVTYDNTMPLPSRGQSHSTTITVPVDRMGIGINTVQVSVPGRADTVRTRILVSLGDDLPIATFEEMLAYLRYFALPERLRPLQSAGPADRGAAWAAFLKDTDPIPTTPEHEGLRDYFGRIRQANVRFRDEGLMGWQTDRGITFVALGDPDNVMDTGLNDPNARVRQQVWEYRELRLQLVFIDQTGFGRWRLSTQQRTELDNAIRRKLAAQPTAR